IHIFGESSTETPWRLENLLAEFPQVTFVALDGFGTLDRSRQLTAVARRHSNVMFDNALMLSYSRVGEDFVKSVGSQRLCFGSDLYFDTMFYKHVTWLQAIKEYAVSERDKENICSGNARKLFRL
ncbi:MAG: amidohydrolase family protein, partial [Dehalococcoidia bacterium]|nr:amidohydrolase family protein [Dehalococcoidia bacterium]